MYNDNMEENVTQENPKDLMKDEIKDNTVKGGLTNSDEMIKLLELNKRYVKKFCHSSNKLSYEKLITRYDILLELADVNMIHWENCINQYKRLETVLEEKEKALDQRESLIDELERSYERLNEEEKGNRALKKKIKEQDKIIFDLQQKSPDILILQIKLIMEQLNANINDRHNELLSSIKTLHNKFDDLENADT